MQIKLFGKNIFEFKKEQSIFLINQGIDGLKKSEFLPDFYGQTGLNLNSDSQSQLYALTEGDIISTAKRIKKEQAKNKKKEITPKEAYSLKLLNEESFEIKTDEKYIDEQIENFKNKFQMIKKEEYDMNRGVIEIQSILIRLENRKKYPNFSEFYSEFAYTTNNKVSELLRTHEHLKLGQVAQFMADMPKEAIDVMKEYTEQTKKLCDKKPVFYIIAKSEDFKKTEKRRDPILLAQSPFGHFWQILGAWDEEMLLLEDL